MEREILCPECDGEGVVWHIKRSNQSWYAETCPVCHGDKYIIKNDEIEEE